MPRMRPNAAEMTAALVGAVVIAVIYAGGRSMGLTRSDLARRLAPDQPTIGRAAQLAVGTLAALPGARASSPLRAVASGAALGALASRKGRAFSCGAHALAALVAQRVAARS
jgi:hypothetical protein